jgi:hypothetical protein
MIPTGRVVELFGTLIRGEITVQEFIQVAQRFSDEELRHFHNILRAVTS